MTGLPAGIWIEVIGLTLLHFLWQGGLIAGLFWLVDRRLRGNDARVRYLVALVFLALTAVCALGTFAYLASNQVAVDTADAAGTAPAGTVATGAGDPSATGTTSSPPTWLTVIVTFWFVGVLAYGSYLLMGLHRLTRIRRQAETAPEWLRLRLEALLEGFGIRQPVILGISDRIQGPLTMGWLKPVILVPPAVIAGFSPHQLQMILAHELAHVRRHDYLVNLCQLALETLLFYHPAVHWISYRIRCLREECCDDLAVSSLDDRYGYARTLAELETMRHQPDGLALYMAEGQILSRIRRLIEPRRKQRGFAGITMILSAVTVICLAALTHSAVNLNGDEETSNPSEEMAEQLRHSHMATRVVLAASRVEALGNERTVLAENGSDETQEEETTESEQESRQISEDQEPRTQDPDEEPDPVDELRREANTAEVADQILQNLVTEEGWLHPEAELSGPGFQQDDQERADSLDEDRDAQMEDRGRQNLERMRERARQQREDEEQESEDSSGDDDNTTDGAEPTAEADEAATSMDTEETHRALALNGDAEAQYPEDALAEGADGRVTLSLEVGGDGQVDAVEVVKNESPGYGFAQAAKEAMEDLAFVPALNGADSVTVTRTVDFNSPTEGPECTPQTGSRLNRC